MTTRQPYKAYSRASHTVAKTRQVVMLYDGAIRFIQQAKVAIEAKDINERYGKLVKAGDVIVGLQSCLDFESGGHTAQVLYDFYSTTELRILNLHRSNDANECDALVRDLKQMRDVWYRIDAGSDVLSDTPADAIPVEQEMPQESVAAGTLTVSA